MQHYTENELAKLIETVEKEFRVDLAKAELAKSEAAPVAEPLAKAEDEKKDAKPEQESDKEAKPEEKPEEKKDEAPEGNEEAKEDGAPPAEAGKEAAPEAHAEAGQEGHDYDEEDLAHMQKMYMSMSKAELKAHHDAIRGCLDAQGMQKCGDMHMAKSEDTVTVIEVKPEDVKPEVQSEDITMLKSEVEAQKAKAETLQKTLDGVTEFLTKLAQKAKVPQGKAVTSYDVIAKSEDAGAGAEQPMTKTEIFSVLSKKAQDPSLSKADREAINAFYLNNASVNSISHLLK